MRPPALGYRLRAGISAYGTSNLNTFKLQNQDSKLNARHSESQRDRWQDEYVHSLRIRSGPPAADYYRRRVPGNPESSARVPATGPARRYCRTGLTGGFG